jgi:simple sugar transport system permease protein
LIHALLIFASPDLWAAVLRIATPLVYGTLGALLCERAGILNLGIEGIMTFGAMIGWLAVYRCGDVWLGLVAAFLCGAAFGLLHALLTVELGLSQHVTGLGITLFASSLAYFIYGFVIPPSQTPPTIIAFQPLHIAWLSGLPFVGGALFAQTAPTYLAGLLTVIIAYALTRTPLGLAVRLVGENPHAAEAQGINPNLIRFGCVVLGSGLMGIGGAFLTLSAFNSFFPGMNQGRGWICIALVVFASWRPRRALLGALLFALFDAYQLRLTYVVGDVIPYQFFLMIPYIMSIIALSVMSRKARVPQALMRPYRRGER